jgi:hypothetical protein
MTTQIIYDSGQFGYTAKQSQFFSIQAPFISAEPSTTIGANDVV